MGNVPTRRLLIALLAGGCAYPTLADVEGHRIAHPLRSGTFESGAVAVDGQPANPRLVVELQVPAMTGDPLEAPAALPLIRLDHAYELRPARVAREAPWCPPAHAVPRNPSSEPPETGPVRRLDWRNCFSVIRAEFAVPESVLHTDSLVVVYAGRSFLVRWRER